MKWIVFMMCAAVSSFFIWFYWSGGVDRMGEAAILDGNIHVGGDQGLVEAIVARDRDLTRKLLDGGANPNSTNRFGDTALMWAVNNGDVALVETLLKKGADPHVAGSYGYQPLHLSAKKGYLDATRLLMRHGAEVNVPDSKGNTPLMVAARENKLKSLQFLLSKGANPNLANKRGETALITAVAYEADEVVESLVLAGSALDHQARSGQTALSLAVSKDNKRFFLSPGVLKKYPDMEERLASLVRVEVLNQHDAPEFDPEIMVALIHELVNEERKARGLTPLVYDSDLANLAHDHSKDMGRNGYFNHINLQREGPTERAQRQGLSIKRVNRLGAVQTGVGENIYMGYTSIGSSGYVKGGVNYVTRKWLNQEDIAKMAVDGWMESPGHRANILFREFVKEGLGIYITEDREIYITQNFQ